MQDSLAPHPAPGSNDTMSSSIDAADLTSLVAAAIGGSQAAWRDLYRRYHALISAIARQYRLTDANVEDIGQAVWLKLVVHLKDLRDPQALPGWIATTTRNEALRMIRANRRAEPVDPQTDTRLHLVDNVQLDENLNRTERQQALRALIGQLRPEHRALFRLLLADPQLPYSEISRQLGMPVGSIGPTRARCLARLRVSSALNAISPEMDAA